MQSPADELRRLTRDSFLVNTERILFSRQLKIIRDAYLSPSTNVDDLAIDERLVSISQDFETEGLIVGRDQTIAHVAQVLQDGRKLRSNQMLVITGPSGIGKTTLIDHLVQYYMPPRTLLLRGKFSQYGTSAFGCDAITDILEELYVFVTSLEGDAREQVR